MDIRRSTAGVGTATIDLGDVSLPEPVEAPAPVSPRVLRRLRTALVILLVLFALAGGSPGSSHLISPLWTRQVSLAGFTLGPDRLTLSDPGARSFSGRDLVTGAVRWQVPIPDPVEYMTTLSDGVTGVVIRNVDVEAAQAISESEVTLLVTGAGAIMSRLPGTQVTVTPTASLLLVATGQQSVTVGCPPDAPVCSDVAGFDLTGARQVWRRALPGQVVPVGPADGQPLTRFALVRRPDAVDVRDPATGDLVRTLSLPESLLSGTRTPQLMQLGDTLLVAVRQADHADLLAMAVGPAGRDWAATLPVSRIVGDQTGRFYLSACGRLVCLHADGADALFELETGRPRGQVGYMVVGQVGETLLAVPSTEQPGTPQTRRKVYLLRAVDGQVRQWWDDTVVVPWRESGGLAMLARQGPEATAFTVLDGYGGTRLVGTVSGADLTCQASRDLLTCADPGGFLRTWRLPTRQL